MLKMLGEAVILPELGHEQQQRRKRETTTSYLCRQSVYDEVGTASLTSCW